MKFILHSYYGMMYELDQPLYKDGDINNVNNYQTIVVGSIMPKLFGDIMDSKLSEWAKKGGKEAYGQVGL